MLLITGGLGFIGSHTTVEALRAGHHVVILDNLSNAGVPVLEGIRRAASGRVIFVEGDCRNTALVTSLLTEHGVTGVIHFAALKAVAESIQMPLEYYDNNLNGLASVLRAMRDAKISQFIFSSSAAVYGIPQKLPIDENHPLSVANSPYGFTKLAGEKIISDWVTSGVKLNAILLRYFNPIGADHTGEIGELPNGIPNNLMPYLIQVAAGKRDKLTVFGRDYDTPDGTCVRDFIHVSDLARAHLVALGWLDGKALAAPEIFNLGTGQGHSVLELIQAFEKASAQKLNYEFGPRRVGDTAVLYADPARAERVLNWRAEKTFADAVATSWRWAEQLRKY